MATLVLRYVQFFHDSHLKTHLRRPVIIFEMSGNWKFNAGVTTVIKNWRLLSNYKTYMSIPGSYAETLMCERKMTL